MMEIAKLIKQPEPKVLEFKRDLSSLGPILKTYDQQAIPNLSGAALDYEKIKKIFLLAGKEITDKKLLSLGVLVRANNKTVPSIGGLILFGNAETRERYVPDARVKCARFRGKDKSQLIDQYEVEDTIIDAVDEVPKFIARNTRLMAQIKKIRRKDISEYPEIALREILINALAHADYSLPGSTIQIAIFDNRLEVQNPGMLPFGFTMEDLKAGVSRVRNRVIAKVFHELKLMEEWGSGYKRVVEECRNNGYPQPEWTELGTFIRVALTPYTKTAQKTTIESPTEELSDREKIILNFFKKGQTRPFRDIFEKLSLNISQRMLRYVLSQLKHKGLLISSGKGPSTVWRKAK